MTEEELAQARKEYEYKYKELSKLEQDPKVKRYIELKELNILSKEELAIEILKKYGQQTKEPNNVYILLGVKSIDRGMFQSKFYKYINIETQEIKNFSDYHDFEAENFVIDSVPGFYPTQDELLQTINEYYGELYKTSQEEAIQKMKSKCIKWKN